MAQDLADLTVPQLKSLCKVRKIKGYSKLGRPALLQLLSEIARNGQTGPGPTLSKDSTSLVISNPVSTSSSDTKTKSNVSKKIGTSNSQVLVNSASRSLNPPSIPAIMASHDQPHAEHLLVCEDLRSTFPVAVSGRCPESQAHDNRMQPSQLVPTPSAEPQPSKTAPGIFQVLATPTTSIASPAKRSASPAMTHAHKKSKVLPANEPDINPTVPLVSMTSSNLTSPAPSASNGHNSLRNIRSIPNTVRTSVPLQYLASAGTKRFKPLVLAKPLGKSGPASSSIPQKRTYTSASTRRLLKSTEQPIILRYLDFFCSTPVPSLQSISLPPSLAQRRRVQCWAIILAGISNGDRRSCVLVSRMFRYAVYLSASHILEQHYAGRRLTQIRQQYSVAMTNMWPYLRIRDVEASDGQALFLSSCLGKLFGGSDTRHIANRLWANPDHKRQISVVMRFILSRYWFILSIGARPEHRSSWLEEMVVDAQEIIPNEIWSITVRQPGCSVPRTFYVLESTCEVVGHTASATGTQESVSHSIVAPRADWSTYIQEYTMDRRRSQATPITLIERLKWDGYEEYEKGISRLWLRNLSDSEEDYAKQLVATRYVLACVVGNSVSGSWKTTSEMAQEFAGLSAKRDSVNSKAKESALNLYLPSHHHVESVHFRTSTGEPLHGALAAVQTLHREYFVLRDIGMEVGNEENGVYDVWMKVLSCSNKGIPL